MSERRCCEAPAADGEEVVRRVECVELDGVDGAVTECFEEDDVCSLSRSRSMPAPPASGEEPVEGVGVGPFFERVVGDVTDDGKGCTKLEELAATSEGSVDGVEALEMVEGLGVLEICRMEEEDFPPEVGLTLLFVDFILCQRDIFTEVCRPNQTQETAEEINYTSRCHGFARY